MSTITRDAFISSSHTLTLELPPDSPTGDVVVTLAIQARDAAHRRQNRMAELEGKYAGRIWMADDFDAPLEDFAEYM